MRVDERLLVELRPKLRRMAFGMLSAADDRHAEDLAQEGWIAVWRALGEGPGYRGDPGGLIGWCMAVARNRMHNWIRETFLTLGRGERNSTPATDIIENMARDGLLAALNGAEALDSVSSAYHHGEVLAAVSELPPAQRAYIEDRFWHGVPLHELDVRRHQWPKAKRRLSQRLGHLVGASATS